MQIMYQPARTLPDKWITWQSEDHTFIYRRFHPRMQDYHNYIAVQSSYSSLACNLWYNIWLYLIKRIWKNAQVSKLSAVQVRSPLAGSTFGIIYKLNLTLLIFKGSDWLSVRTMSRSYDLSRADLWALRFLSVLIL